MVKSFLGEFIGTFIMVFFGVGVVATTVLFGAHSGTLQVGIVWGIAIALAIYATRNLSNAHFNTAVSVAMVVSGRMSWRDLPVYIVGQLAGAIAASGVLWLLLGSSVEQVLASSQVGFAEPSPASAIFVETYPNTANAVVSTPVAFLAEALGTFTLVCLIFALTEGANLGRPSPSMAPLFIGLTVTIIICVVGPLTDAGLNPARDMGPRIVGALAGWSAFAFSWEILLVYVGGPLAGGVLAALLTVTVLEPICRKRQDGKGAEEPAGEAEAVVQTAVMED